MASHRHSPAEALIETPPKMDATVRLINIIFFFDIVLSLFFCFSCPKTRGFSRAYLGSLFKDNALLLKKSMVFQRCAQGAFWLSLPRKRSAALSFGPKKAQKEGSAMKMGQILFLISASAKKTLKTLLHKIFA